MAARIIWTLNILFLLSLALRGQNSPEPSELVSLRASWQKARDQAVLPIDKKYEEALKSLKDRFTKAGNLEAALHADSELKKITSAKQQSLAQGQQPMSPKSEAAKEKSKLIGEFKNKFGSIFEIRSVTSSGKIAGSFVDPTGVLGDITGEIWEGDINQAQITYLHLKKECGRSLKPAICFSS